MIYQINNMLLNVTQKLYTGEVNDVVICQDLSAVTKVFYTVWVIRDHRVTGKVLSIFENFNSDGTTDNIVCGTYNDQYLFVFPYIIKRPIEDFFKAEIETLDECEKLCSEVVIKCITSSIPFPIMSLMFAQKQINKSKGGEVYFGYCLDLKNLSEEDDESKCTNQCALMLFEMLGRVTDESTVSYMLLKKKTARAGYMKFIDLYKDIQAATDKIEKKKFWVRVKLFFARNRDRIFRFLIFICITAAIIALIMLISQLIFGDIPIFRLFFNPFKKIGTESLIN